MPKTKKKNTLKESKQTNARDDYKPRTLDEVWGGNGTGKYGTLDENEYIDSIKEMSTTDLQSHAMKYGVQPITDRARLESVLITEFKKHVYPYLNTAKNNTQSETTKVKNKDLPENVKQMLREMR